MKTYSNIIFKENKKKVTGTILFGLTQIPSLEPFFCFRMCCHHSKQRRNKTPKAQKAFLKFQINENLAKIHFWKMS